MLLSMVVESPDETEVGMALRTSDACDEDEPEAR